MADSESFTNLRPAASVAAGGFVGATARHAVALAAPTPEGGTLAVNVAGSFLLGLLLYEARLAGVLSARIRLALGTGVLSSFTTYSTFAVQTAALGGVGGLGGGTAGGATGTAAPAGVVPRAAAVNVLANYALGFLAVVAAGLVARWLS